MSIIEPRLRLYSRDELTRLLAPRSVAIIGASPRKGSFGERVLANLKTFNGAIYPVNPNYDSICDLKAYPDLESLPETPDCVVLAVPRDAVEACVLSCARVGAGGVVIFASGYTETGKAHGQELETRLTQIARETGLRIVGPNSMGFANYADQALLSFTSYHPCDRLLSASIGVASQSGGLSFSLGDAVTIGASFSHLLSTGNSCDVDVADLVSYLSEDPACKAIVCMLEGMRHPRRLMAAAEIAWKNDKPLIVNKIARGEQGAAAAVSHTGALAGSDAAYKAMLERTGAILVDRFEDIIEVAAFFAKAPKPRAEGVAVLSPSGGAAIMAADFAELHHVALPQPSPVVAERLKQQIPDFGSSRNPCDVTAQVVNNPESLAECAEALIGDGAYDVLLLAQPQAYATAAARVAMIGQLAAKHGKIACNVLVSQWNDGPGARESAGNEHVALFRSMDRCFGAIASWHKRERLRLAQDTEPSELPWQEHKPVRDAARLLDAVTGDVLGESQATQVLAAYGVPVTHEELAQSESDAVRHAEWLGYPVALKVESAHIPHKTEADVIRLNLRSTQEVRTAYKTILKNAYTLTSPEGVRGVLVQQMIPQGLEVMVGAREDVLFGPLIVIGLGGILVELLNDTVTALAPVTPAEAMRMLEKLKGRALLHGFRGSKPIAIDRLAEVISRVSQLIADHGEQIQEIDVNPLICSHDRIVAVDALIVKKTRCMVDEIMCMND
ncbi:acetate--CoA ligase family protein [Alcaligenaceae bacterium]|nr:acetate--CoA ligase family protein [Alcaligenaceae bacterium]